MKLNKTCRGFAIVEFEDRNEQKCSLQKSSLATEDAIWLGVQKVEPMILGNNGWVPVEVPEGTMLSSRMHLTQSQVKELLPFLQKFVKTGRLS